MRSKVSAFKSRKDLSFSSLHAQLDAPEIEHALLITQSNDGYWHIGNVTEGLSSIELIGILELVKQDVIEDYNRQQPR